MAFFSILSCMGMPFHLRAARTPSTLLLSVNINFVVLLTCTRSRRLPDTSQLQAEENSPPAPPQLRGCTAHTPTPFRYSPSSLGIYSILLFSDTTQVKCCFSWHLTSEDPAPSQSMHDAPVHFRSRRSIRRRSQRGVVWHRLLHLALRLFFRCLKPNPWAE